MPPLNAFSIALVSALVLGSPSLSAAEPIAPPGAVAPQVQRPAMPGQNAASQQLRQQNRYQYRNGQGQGQWRRQGAGNSGFGNGSGRSYAQGPAYGAPAYGSNRGYGQGRGQGPAYGSPAYGPGRGYGQGTGNQGQGSRYSGRQGGRGSGN